MVDGERETYIFMEAVLSIWGKGGICYKVCFFLKLHIQK